ncbi:hypothetical protein ACTGJ9_039430 [Bradyrhizobium sp. RDM12]
MIAVSDGGLTVVIDQTTVICHEPSVSRASVAAEKLKTQQMRL